MIKKIVVAYVIILFAFFSSCNNIPKSSEVTKGDISVKGFSPLTNFKSSYIDSTNKTSNNNIKAIALDYFKAYKGFTIPSIRQTEDGYFHFEFDVKYHKSQSAKLYYKIFYQND